MSRTHGWIALVVALVAATSVVAAPPAAAIPADAPPTGMVCTSGSLSGSTRTFHLVAKVGYISTPDGNSVYMWSYANADAPDNGHFQEPGPVLCVTQGESVVVALANSLPEPSSIVFPGQDSAVSATGGTSGLLTREAPSGGSVSYQFTAGSPGTYLYQSGSDLTRQVEMGLAGALVVRPSIGSGYAYDASTAFDPSREYLLLLSEIDPDLHHAVELASGSTPPSPLPAFDFNALRNRYFSINGREFPDTLQDNGSGLLPEQPYGALVRIQPGASPGALPALVRMINVGAINHPFHPHGNHTRQIAQDGRLLLGGSGGSASSERFGETVGAGETEDYLLRWDDSDGFNPTTNPFPVPQPNYRNLTFKDANTFYSGSPYLGYKGTLPTGTVSQNVCGEWYFPFHSHALNEFTNYDQGFGGMGTLLRVDPPGGCTAAASSTNLVGGVLQGGSVTALAFADSSYLQIGPRVTARPPTSGTMSTTASTTTVSSATGFPSVNGFYVRIDSEVMQVTAGAGTTTWTVCRTTACRLGTSLATHPANAPVTALATDWYAGFTGLPAAAQNLRVTYTGKNCANATGTPCAAITSNQPLQTVKICDWTIAGAAGCSTATSAGWVTLPAPPAQPRSVGSTDVSSTWTLPGAAGHYVGTGSSSGQVRVLVHTDRWTSPAPTAFSTWGNALQVGYDAP